MQIPAFVYKINETIVNCEVDLCRLAGQHHQYLARLAAVRRTPAQHVVHQPIAWTALLAAATILISPGGKLG